MANPIPVTGAAGCVGAVERTVTVDSNYAVWQGFNNESWPTLYFVRRTILTIPRRLQ